MDNMTFEKNRVISFSDAVFSIAMTLLVLEVGIPSIKMIESYSTWTILQSRLPSFIGLVVSFFVTALYWVAHLRAMKFVTVFDEKLLWLNIFLLFFIVLLPFSTGFYVGGMEQTGPFVFYCFNLSAIGFFNYLMLRYIIKKESGNNGLTPLLGKWHKAIALNGFLIWVLAGVVAFALPTIARIMFALIFVFNVFINKYYRKKINKAKINQ